MSKRLENFVNRRRVEIEAALRRNLPVSSLPGARSLNDALEYAVFPGGKRLRPALALLASELTGAPTEQGLKIACALEFLHNSSLILDDLPAMDDAHLRRNRHTLHMVFGEGVAMLAAIALLNHSYALLAEAARGCGAPGAVESLVAEAARAVGADGMVGGQVVDLETRAGSADADALSCRDLKTVALMRLMMTAGALASGAQAEETSALADFGECFGRAYQVCDDIMDETKTSDVTGKPSCQDARHMRACAVTMLGVEGAWRFAERLVARGVASLSERFGAREEVRLLADAAYYVLDRSAGSSVPPQRPQVLAEAQDNLVPVARGRDASRGQSLFKS